MLTVVIDVEGESNTRANTETGRDMIMYFSIVYTRSR